MAVNPAHHVVIVGADFGGLEVARYRPMRNAHRVPTFIGVSRESFHPGKLHSKRLATGDLLTNQRICEKVRLVP
jgi:NADH dehydrogenase FAD-containing subunit